MVYFSKEQLTIRNMEPGDAQEITDAEIEQGWNATISGSCNILLVLGVANPGICSGKSPENTSNSIR